MRRLLACHAVRHVHEARRVRQDGHPGPVRDPRADDFRGQVVPELAAHGVVRLVEHDVGRLPQDQARVGQPLGDEGADPRRQRVDHVPAELEPLGVAGVRGSGGQCQPARVLEPALLAAAAVADAVVALVVVLLVHAGPVEEETVYWITPCDFVEDVEYPFLVISPARTYRYQVTCVLL